MTNVRADWRLAFASGFAIGLSGCATFAYHYYGLEGVSYRDGKLLGTKESLDRPFADCAPTSATRHPCVVMFAKDFFALKLDYEDTKGRLEACERRP